MNKNEKLANKWKEIEKENWIDRICTSPQHQPPSHLYIPPGKIHIHVCPSCGQETPMMGKRIICDKPEIFKNKTRFTIQLYY